MEHGVYSLRALAAEAEEAVDLLMGLPHTVPTDRVAAVEIGRLLALIERIDEALARRGMARSGSLLDARLRASGRLARWLTPNVRREAGEAAPRRNDPVAPAKLRSQMFPIVRTTRAVSRSSSNVSLNTEVAGTAGKPREDKARDGDPAIAPRRLEGRGHAKASLSERLGPGKVAGRTGAATVCQAAFYTLAGGCRLVTRMRLTRGTFDPGGRGR
jgi:hypothetical protein